MLTVELTMEGGVIQDVSLPKGVKLIVRDYDMEAYGDDHEQLKKDGDGDQYIETVYEDASA